MGRGGKGNGRCRVLQNGAPEMLGHSPAALRSGEGLGTSSVGLAAEGLRARGKPPSRRTPSLPMPSLPRSRPRTAPPRQRKTSNSPVVPSQRHPREPQPRSHSAWCLESPPAAIPGRRAPKTTRRSPCGIHTRRSPPDWHQASSLSTDTGQGQLRALPLRLAS